MARTATREHPDLEAPTLDHPGLRLIDELVEDAAVQPASTWVSVLEEWALENIDKYRTRTRDGWMFQFPDDPTKSSAYTVSELPHSGLRFGIDMPPPGYDKENGRYVLNFSVRLYPVEFNNDSQTKPGEEDKPLKHLVTHPNGDQEWVQNGHPRNATRDMAVIDVYDEKGTKTRKTIARYSLKPELSNATHNVLINRCANMFIREIRKRCLARGIEFNAISNPLPKPSGDAARAMEDHGMFSCYVK